MSPRLLSLHLLLDSLRRYRNKERHGLSRTAPQVAAKAAADAVLLAIQTGQEPEPSNEVSVSVCVCVNVFCAPSLAHCLFFC
jgi:hypothetical protein